MSDKRLLLVHAHPDDESINNGATMAKYVDAGIDVTLVTCTAGEMGEVLVPDLAHLAYEQDGGLGEHRKDELAEAMAVLGVTDHRFLGGFGRFHDSGMAWHEDGHAVAGEVHADNAFWHADLTEAADELVKVIREIKPQVLVTYDQFGGYGHPDHIQAHRVAMYGALLAAAPSYRLDLGEPHDIAKIYWTAMSEGRMRESLRQLRESGDTETFKGMEPDGKLPPFVTPDELINARIDGAATVGRKMEALAKHRTQVQADGPFFQGAESGHSWWSDEFYRLVKGTPGPVDDEGFEPDLFAGM
ncbi:MAG: N-acetyl-1-D-myo-inositol-2-amino-2-deoxy-alpha-D-glucopyranoside deacetylase [Nocardioides sp.]